MLNNELQMLVQGKLQQLTSNEQHKRVNNYIYMYTVDEQ